MPEYLSLFYIFNFLLIAIYPLIRNYGHTFMLNIRDTWGFNPFTFRQVFLFMEEIHT